MIKDRAVDGVNGSDNQPTSYSVSRREFEFDISTWLDMIAQGKVVFPNYHRGFVWTQEQASRFIESLLLGLPIQPVYLRPLTDSSYDEYAYEVVDGQQRLLTVKYFVDGRLPDGQPFILRGVAADFEGLVYQELSLIRQEDLLAATIPFVAVTQTWPDGESVYPLLYSRLNLLTHGNS